jgi:hypothetical protein
MMLVDASAGTTVELGVFRFLLSVLPTFPSHVRCMSQVLEFIWERQMWKDSLFILPHTTTVGSQVRLYLLFLFLSFFSFFFCFLCDLVSDVCNESSFHTPPLFPPSSPHQVINGLGYTPSQYDTSLYVLKSRDVHGVIWVHVKDGVVTASSVELLLKLEQDLKDVLKIKWSHSPESIVGLAITCNSHGFILNQPKLINSMLKNEWDGVVRAKIPLPPNYNATTELDRNSSSSTKYLLLIGTMSYLAVGTRPDISFAVNSLARFSAKALVTHWKGLRHLVN